jgi:alkaline phosphatase D
MSEASGWGCGSHSDAMHKLLTRREALAAALAGGSLRAEDVGGTRQATGVKVGEITPTSVVIWTRRTRSARRVENGARYRASGTEATHLAQDADVNAIEGACAGEAGYIKVTLEAQSGPRHSKPWTPVSAEADFTHQFRIDGLRPATVYRYAVETKRTRGGRAESALVGRFRTAPLESAHAAVQFVLMTCQMYCHMDREDGFHIYDSIQKLQPDFYVSCGDNVYYDSESPIANSVAVARYHWHRMFSLPTVSSCLLTTPGYWQKDDHDVYSDDCWSTLRTPKMGAFRFEDGQRIFREQAPVPTGELYRRFRWGSAVEIWRSSRSSVAIGRSSGAVLRD